MGGGSGGRRELSKDGKVEEGWTDRGRERGRKVGGLRKEGSERKVCEGSDRETQDTGET